MNVGKLSLRMLVSALILGGSTMACAVDSTPPAADLATDAPTATDGQLSTAKKDVALSCTAGGSCTCPAGQSAYTCPHPFGFNLCVCIKPPADTE